MSEWDEFIADWSARSGIPEWQLEWLVRDLADRDNREWDHLDEIRRLGT